MKLNIILCVIISSALTYRITVADKAEEISDDGGLGEAIGVSELLSKLEGGDDGGFQNLKEVMEEAENNEEQEENETQKQMNEEVIKENTGYDEMKQEVEQWTPSTETPDA